MKTRKLRKSMMSAVVILMAAVLSLTGATYAWFTTGDSAEVGAITAGVEEGSGLLISTDGSSWMSSVSLTTKEGFKLNALSSAGNVVNGELDLFRAVLDTSSSPNKVKEAVKQAWTADTTVAEEGTTTHASRTAGFIAFDVYFNNANGSAKNILVTGGLSSGTNNKYAMRIAFIKQGVIATADATATLADDLQDLKLTSGTAAATGDVKIFEPFANGHVNSGLLDYKTYDPDATGSQAFEYFGIAKAFTDPMDRYAAGNNNELAKVTTVQSDDGAYDSAMFTVDAQSYVKLTVVIWLEGQDADCVNEISGGNITYDIGFTVAAATQG